ncbi:MAG: hypothetical protein JWO96_389 [Candidatus Saccharibacteria bacterium]|nr:hypothetical protein [Candidatus Saccharibacteria bacterium]
MSDIKELQGVALEVQQEYAELNRKKGHREWTAKDYALGLMGDMGSLMKLITAKDNLRKIEDVDARLAHELADCLWSLLILARKYNVDLEKEFHKTMNEIQVRIREVKV